MIHLLKEYLSYNPDSGEIFWIKKPSVCVHVGQKAGTIDNEGYYRTQFKGKRYSNHRLAWYFTYGFFPKMLDHINGNRLDNRIENLRISNDRRNCQNRKRHRDGRLVGAHFNKKRKVFSSSVCVGKKVYKLGYFGTEKEAHEAYVKKLISLGIPMA
jgi:hypothetical protein